MHSGNKLSTHYYHVAAEGKEMEEKNKCILCAPAFQHRTGIGTTS